MGLLVKSNSKSKIADVGGALDYHAPLFSFHSIYDIDIGLVNLIREKYLDDKVFEPSFFKQHNLKIISDMYTRNKSNPLSVFARKNISDEDLDDYYKQFLDKEYVYIYENCVSTEVLNYIRLFSGDKEIIPHILCYNDYEEKIIKDEPVLKDLKIIRPNSERKLDVKTQRSFSSVFFKKVEEVELFDSVVDLVFYIASYGPNFESDRGPRTKNPMLRLTPVLERNSIFPTNTFNIYDMYNGKYFERIENNNG